VETHPFLPLLPASARQIEWYKQLCITEVNFLSKNGKFSIQGCNLYTYTCVAICKPTPCNTTPFKLDVRQLILELSSVNNFSPQSVTVSCHRILGLTSINLFCSIGNLTKSCTKLIIFLRRQLTLELSSVNSSQCNYFFPQTPGTFYSKVTDTIFITECSTCSRVQQPLDLAS
jgi:hypothetical protein